MELLGGSRQGSVSISGARRETPRRQCSLVKASETGDAAGCVLVSRFCGPTRHLRHGLPTARLGVSLPPVRATAPCRVPWLALSSSPALSSPGSPAVWLYFCAPVSLLSRPSEAAYTETK